MAGSWMSGTVLPQAPPAPCARARTGKPLSNHRRARRAGATAGQAEGAAARARGTAPAVFGSIPHLSAPPPPGSRCNDHSAVILREKLTGWLPGVTAETTTGRRKRSSGPSGPGARHGDPSRSHRTPGAR